MGALAGAARKSPSGTLTPANPKCPALETVFLAARPILTWQGTGLCHVCSCLQISPPSNSEHGSTSNRSRFYWNLGSNRQNHMGPCIDWHRLTSYLLDIITSESKRKSLCCSLSSKGRSWFTVNRLCSSLNFRRTCISTAI